MSDVALSRNASREKALSRRYVVPPGGYDEMVDAEGRIRPAWDSLTGFLDGLGPAELERRWLQAEQLIHDNGVSFNVYGDQKGMERPWKLSPIPLVFSPAEFNDLSAGLAQRAWLLDRLLADVYGPKRCLVEGWVPADLVLGHPGYLRPCHGVRPPRGRWLHLYAADIGRDASGSWRVLTDRTQAPSGAGYALENRIVVSRVFPDAFAACNAQRLALFFRSMRENLAALAPHNRDNPRVVLLSPGPFNATYFEQAFLAQYLGYQLVDGGDLTVREGRVYLKTLGGLLGVDVILRRLNDDYCDPLELRPDSTLGVPGLVEAVRSGGVAMANALGAGVAQTHALLPYLGRLARGLLGEDLKLHGAETWWCGEPSSLSHVLANLETFVIRPAMTTGFTQPIFGERLSKSEREELAARLKAHPHRYVGQERVALSTTPLLRDDGLDARRVVLRSFLVARDSGYDVMPGGLGLVAGSPDELEISVQRGAGSKDVWVTSGAPVSNFSLLKPPTQPVPLSRGGSDLPSRIADNLFWLGRYAERADGIARLARTLVFRLGDKADSKTFEASEHGAFLQILNVATQTELKAIGDKATPEGRSPEERLLEALLSTESAGSLRGTIRSTVRVAGVIRDRISMDTWRILTTLDQEMRDEDVHHSGNTLGVVSAMLDRLVMTLAALSGLSMDGMTRGQGWRFLDMGRRLERAYNLARVMRATLVGSSEREGPLLETLLEVFDSSITYRRRYLASLQVAPVADLLLADETNPRSVAFQLAALHEHLPQLPRNPSRAGLAPEERLVLGSLSRLRLLDVEAACAPNGEGQRPGLVAVLDELLRNLPALSETLSGSYLSHAVVSRQLAQSRIAEIEGAAGGAPTPVERTPSGRHVLPEGE
jgi:uncharacterized circularly permuted ATP-grasp superfamily protein/uncharacterized alpha-E superfamily protein